MHRSKGRTYIGSYSEEKTAEGNVLTCSTGSNGRMEEFM